MIRRQCPECGRGWYSAVTQPWPCGYCGTMLDDRHRRPLERGDGDEDTGYLRRHK
jgi:tRNA(Ile2) C34 agmatinyltransferase TiaS